MAYQPYERFWTGDPYLLKELLRKENIIADRYIDRSRNKVNRKDEVLNNQDSVSQENNQKTRNPFSEDHIFGVISRPFTKEGKRSTSVEEIINGKFIANCETDLRRRAQRPLDEIKPCRDLTYNELFSGSKNDDIFKRPRISGPNRSISVPLPEEILPQKKRVGRNSRSFQTGSTIRSRGLEFPSSKHISPITKRSFSPNKAISKLSQSTKHCEACGRNVIEKGHPESKHSSLI